jgi:hypothetical protein
VESGAFAIVSALATKGRFQMSADWYFIKKGFFHRQKRIGPVCEMELLTRISKGDIAPDTLLSSTTKTHGKWLAMRNVKPAYQHWKETHPGATDAA